MLLVCYSTILDNLDLLIYILSDIATCTGIKQTNGHKPVVEGRSLIQTCSLLHCLINWWQLNYKYRFYQYPYFTEAGSSWFCPYGEV